MSVFLNESWIESVWYGTGAVPRIVRGILTPVSWLYGAVVAARNWAYDTGLFRSVAATIPVVSVGNVTVGGTGKTPLVAWLATEYQRRGHRPAIVMRGYGDDEPKVHAVLAPGIPVYTTPRRADGVAAAAASGATIAILDDAMQHRQLRRDQDIVVISADRPLGRFRLLPAGPYREPVRAVRRASCVIVTAKHAGQERVANTVAAIRALAASVHIGVAHLASAALVDVHDAQHVRSLDDLQNAKVLAVAAIGDPAAFFAQLTDLGAQVTEKRYRDHHPYSAEDVAELVRLARDHKYCVTTLKDAVKLAPLWPEKETSLWYVSQVITVNDECSFIAKTS